MALGWLWSAVALASPVAYVGATLHPVDAPNVEDGVLLVDGSTIQAVGSRAAVAVPADAKVVDLTGKHLMPGLVDTHSHVGGGQYNDALAPIQPALSAIDTIDVSHDSLKRVRAGGVTTANVMPGSGKLMGGQTAYIKLRDARVVDDLLMCIPRQEPLPAPVDGPLRRREICGGMKMANGTNPQGGGGDPRSRMGAAYLQRAALTRGVEAVEAGVSATADLEALGLSEVVTGQRTVHFHTHRGDDIVTILALRREFGIDVVLHHVSEAWKVVDALAADPVPCSLIVVDAPGGKEEAQQLALHNGAMLEAAGVPVAFHTDDPITDSRLFLRSAGLAVRAGMSPEAALAALTLVPARMMHLEHRIGSLTPGKDADFVVLSGPPLSVWTHVDQTFVEGVPVFDRATAEGERLATGGAPEVSSPDILHDHRGD
ncbi:MAG: amidohydrolase [Deltaproteobacteria bacterium]|nr:amidohydrolase [Deltaproteobacteria bacterium]HCH65327.1 amidohydrolase [Deltaproteobacteria bacterium]